MNSISTLEGWGSYFSNVDLHGDVIRPGAFKRSLSNNGPSRPLLWAHDQSEPIGVAELLEKDHGLWVTAQVSLETQRGRECIALCKMGGLTGFSIGYRVVRDSVDGKQRVLQEIELFEVSAVAIPANPRAVIVRADGATIPGKAAESSIARMTRQIQKIQSAVGCPIPSAKTDADELRDAIAGLQRSIHQATRAARAA